ncbi:MAG: hypothetical protein NTX87_08430 [Planctomycetota bacterium]|nr:hypothetical protein [Planctomycetota bacterium]
MAWSHVQQLCEGRLADRGVTALRAGMDGRARCVLVEPRYVCKDYRNLYGRFYAKKFLERSGYCSRLHFFSSPALTVEEAVFEPERFREAYLGYSVIQPIRLGCLGRTVVDPFKTIKPPGELWCLSTAFKSHINGAEYEVKGYPYFSQSAEAMVCAHAALWGVCRYLSERYSAYGEILPYDLIELTNSSLGRRVPYRGMMFSDYSEILSAFGCHPELIMPKDTGQADWAKDRAAFHDIYSYVESGFPVLASFNGHVATLIGHTLRQDVGSHQPDEGTSFYNSFALVKQFVVVDDNYFPYRLLGYQADPDNYGVALKSGMPRYPSIESLYAAVVPLPEKAFLTPRKARKLAYAFWGKNRGKLDQAVKEAGGAAADPLIARTFLTSSVAFKAQKRLCCLPQGDRPAGWLARFQADWLARFPVDLNLPHFVWIMEVSPLSLYNQGLCVGEIVLDASANEYECEPIYARMGRMLIFGGQEKTQAAGLCGFPLYTHNLGERNA